MESDTSYGDFISLEIFWGSHGENIVNQITRQSLY